MGKVGLVGGAQGTSELDSIEQAEASAAAPKPDPVALLRELHAAGHGLAAESAEGYLEEVREDRRRWRTEQTTCSANRDTVRVLRGVFPIRIVVEGPEPSEVDPLVSLIDRQVALGALEHLPIGCHETRSGGWGRWQQKGWVVDDVARKLGRLEIAAYAAARHSRLAMS